MAVGYILHSTARYTFTANKWTPR